MMVAAWGLLCAALFSRCFASVQAAVWALVSGRARLRRRVELWQPWRHVRRFFFIVIVLFWLHS